MDALVLAEYLGRQNMTCNNNGWEEARELFPTATEKYTP